METHASRTGIPSATEPVQETIFNDLVDTTPYEKNLKNARIWLYVIAAVQTLGAVIEYNTIADKEIALIASLVDVGLAMAFFCLAIWSNKKPFAAFTTALVIYAIISVALLVLNPADISVFYIIKVLVIIALVKAINSAREIEKLKESMGEA